MTSTYARTAALLAGGIVAFGGMAIPAASAFAAGTGVDSTMEVGTSVAANPCREHAISLPNGRGWARYIECHYRDRVTVSGHVKDTEADGRCVKIEVVFSHGGYRNKIACGDGDREAFNWTQHGATDAYVYLSTV